MINLSKECEYSIEQQADLTLADWMHVSGYSQEMLVALPDELLIAVANHAYDMGEMFYREADEGTDNPFVEYIEVTMDELKRRRNYVV